MQPSKHSYKTVRMYGEILGGMGDIITTETLETECTALLMVVSNVTWKTTTASSTSWLKSRKIQLMLHELSLRLWDLHIKAEAAVLWAPFTHPASLEMSEIHKRQSLNQQMSSCRLFVFSFPAFDLALTIAQAHKKWKPFLSNHTSYLCHWLPSCCEFFFLNLVKRCSCKQTQK